MPLTGNFLLPKGAGISVILPEQVDSESGRKYALVNNSSIGKDNAEPVSENLNTLFFSTRKALSTSSKAA